MSLQEFLPPIPQPPHDPTSWLLNGRAGWRYANLKQLEQTPCHSLTLARHPDSIRSLTEANGSFGGLTVPANMALGPDESIYLLDSEAIQLKRFDPCECLFKTVPCFGGEGKGSRQFLRPHGIGICAGNLFVCDTGNHRLSVFALRRFVLRGHWMPPGSAKLVNPWEPYAVAFDGQGRVYVTDGANGCIHRFSPVGRWETCLSGFGKVTYIAIDCQDQLHVVSEGTENVRIVRSNGEAVGPASRPEELTRSFPCPSFAVDAAGNLHLGPLCADVVECEKKGSPARERGVFDLHGNSAPTPAATAPPAYQKEGVYFSQALDSELYRCQWHRVILSGEIPNGARVVVSTYTAEALLTDDQVQSLGDQWETNQTSGDMSKCEWDCLVRSGGGRFLWLKLELRGNGMVTPCLDSIEIEFPRISLRRYLPAVFGAEAISADFTDRFLSLFDTTLRSVERKIDHLARYFDPLSTPAERDPKTGIDFLSWLGSWIGLSLDRHWSEAKRRKFLKNAGRLHNLRGTRAGLWRQLILFLEMEPAERCCPDDQPRAKCQPPPANCAPVIQLPCAWQPPPLILEHYQLRRWLFVGMGRLGDQAVLWGKRIVNRTQLDEGAQVGRSQLITTQDPYRDPFHVYAHKFTVFVPSFYRCEESRRKGLENLLKAESPAHTLHHVQYVEPRFRIGFQSMIGLDSVIGRLPQGVTLDGTPLGRASVLTAPPHDQGGPSLQVGESRIGTTTNLD
ncbi:MAG TPA: phage tail protein [Acidobacteriota bacterium]|jgi:phage tail-like protein